MLFPDSPILRLAWLKRLSGGGGGEPVYKTVSGNPVTFEAVAAPLQQLRADFSPVQAGSGTPAPDNIRPISGWTGLTSTVNGSAVPVSWETEAGTVYGGYVDLVSGELVAEFISLNTTWGQIRTGYANSDTGLERGNANFTADVVNVTSAAKDGVDSFCNIAQISYHGQDWSPEHYYIVNLKAYFSLPSTLDSATEIQLVTRLATPIHYQLTPQIIRTIRGSNTISSDGDTMTVTYRES